MFEYYNLDEETMLAEVRYQGVGYKKKKNKPITWVPAIGNQYTHIKTCSFFWGGEGWGDVLNTFLRNNSVRISAFIFLKFLIPLLAENNLK